MRIQVNRASKRKLVPTRPTTPHLHSRRRFHTTHTHNPTDSRELTPSVVELTLPNTPPLPTPHHHTLRIPPEPQNPKNPATEPHQPGSQSRLRPSVSRQEPSKKKKTTTTPP